MIQKLLFTAIAVLTALPAIALPSFTYTSSAPFPGDRAEFDITPVLVQENESGRLYLSRGFVSTLADDGNLYVDRMFTDSYLDDGSRFIIVRTAQIDCGRGLVRALTGAGSRNGQEIFVRSIDWSKFRLDSYFAKTCEQAASDRGIDWSWATR